MTESAADAAARNTTLARLAQSRAEIRRLLEPPARAQGAHDRGGGAPGDTAGDSAMVLFLAAAPCGCC